MLFDICSYHLCPLIKVTQLDIMFRIRRLNQQSLVNSRNVSLYRVILNCYGQWANHWLRVSNECEARYQSGNFQDLNFQLAEKHL